MTFLWLGIMQMVSYLLATLNIRSAAKGKVGPTVLTDVAMGGMGFFLIKFVVEAKTVTEFVCYCLGGAIGSAVAIKLTKRWDGK